MKMDDKSLWKASGLKGEYQAWAFGGPSDERAELVSKGIQTGTSSAYILYEKEDESLPQVGEYSVILDSRGEAKAIIRTVKVEVLPFNQVPASFAYLEGEGDRSLDYWRSVHHDFFTEELASIGLPFTEDMLVVMETFEVVYPRP